MFLSSVKIIILQIVWVHIALLFFTELPYIYVLWYITYFSFSCWFFCSALVNSLSVFSVISSGAFSSSIVGSGISDFVTLICSSYGSFCPMCNSLKSIPSNICLLVNIGLRYWQIPIQYQVSLVCLFLSFGFSSIPVFARPPCSQKEHDSQNLSCALTGTGTLISMLIASSFVTFICEVLGLLVFIGLNLFLPDHLVLILQWFFFLSFSASWEGQRTETHCHCSMAVPCHVSLHPEMLVFCI